jgi:hypothetical protein
MKKKNLVDPTVRVPFVTSNGVHLLIYSYPRQKMSSNRWDANVIGFYFNDIRTNVYLKDVRTNVDLSDVIVLIKDISELEDSIESIRNSALSFFDEDTSKLIDALGCTSDDLQRLRTTIFSSRDQVIQQRKA